MVHLYTFVRFPPLLEVMNNLIRFCLVVILCAAPFAGVVMATGVGGSPPCWPPPCIPIDGGLSLLVAAGAVLGGKKAFDMRRSRKDAF